MTFYLVDQEVIKITVSPMFSWLKRLDNWMVCSMEVLGSVFIF